MKMQKKSFASLFLIIAILVGCQAFAGNDANAKSIEWTVQSLWPRGDITIDPLVAFAERVEKKSNGRLKMKVFAAPEIAGMDTAFVSLQRGVLDLLSGGVMYGSISPVFDVEFTLPGMYLKRDPEDKFVDLTARVHDFFYNGGMADLLRKEYAKHSVHWLAQYPYSGGIVLLKKKVQTLEDIKGLKLADTGGWTSTWNKLLGWTPAPAFPPEEYSMALKLGTLDGILWSWDALPYMKWHKQAPYVITNPGYCDTANGNILVNMKSWKALPDDLKKIVEAAAEQHYRDMVQANVKLEETLNQILSKDAFKVLMDAKYQQAAASAAQKVWKMAADADPVSAEAIQLIKKWKGIK